MEIRMTAVRQRKLIAAPSPTRFTEFAKTGDIAATQSDPTTSLRIRSAIEKLFV